MPESRRRGFSIRIFLPGGTPDGLRTVEKSNWSGCGIVCPRPQFPQEKARSDFGKTGVYILLGPTSEPERPMLYVGEGDPVRPRLEQHYAKKDFWTTAIVFFSKDANLNKAHVQYLESRLIMLAREAKRCVLDNGNTPQLPSLSEADVADAESFLDEMLLIYPVLGVSVFEKPPAASRASRLVKLKGKGTDARGYESAQGFGVQAGSVARVDTVPSIHKYLDEMRRGLLRDGVFESDIEGLRLTQDFLFDSPSTAAGVMLGRSANGRIEWKDGDGRTLRELQESAVFTSGEG